MKNQKPFFFLCLSATLLLCDLQGQSAPQKTEIKVDTAILKSYVGRYVYDNGLVMNVTLEEGQLYTQFVAQEKIAVFASSVNEFFPKIVDAVLTFETDETGKVTDYIHNQNGMQQKVRRLPDEKEVTVDPVIFDKYVGKFMGDNGQVIEIYKEGNKLFGRTQGLPVCQLHPVSITEFFPVEANARVWFIVDDDGTVNSLNLDFNGYKSTAPRIKE